jgi:flagellar basal-body rod protein FlgG
MAAQQTSMDVIANNLANVNTTGFKETRVSFEDLLYAQVSDRNAARLGAQVGMGVAPGRTELMFSQGDMVESSVPTNMAIEGNGFFQVLLPNGQVGYTRDGSFTRDGNGQMVNQSGHILQPDVVIPVETDPNSLAIGTTGRVTGTVNGVVTLFGQIDIVNFGNPQGLESIGNNIYAANANSGEPQVGTPTTNGLGALRQGFTEGSNVSVMEEMINMITAQRAFESVSKVLSTSDEMLGIANAIRR